MRGSAVARAAGWMIAVGTTVGLVGMMALGFVFAATFVALGPPTLGPGTATNAALLGSGALALFGALVGLLGLALYVLVPAFSKEACLRQDYGSHRVVLACTALATVGGNLVALLYFLPALFLTPSGVLAGPTSQEVEGRLLSPTGIAVAAVSLDVALLAVVYLRLVRPGLIPWSIMGLGRGLLRGRILLGLLFGVVLFAASSVLELLLNQLGITQTQGTIFESVKRASPAEFGLVLLAGALIAPIVEEIYFRGFVFRAYLDRKGPLRAFLFSSLLFAAVHLNAPAFLPLFAMALLLSYFYYRTGSLVPSIVAHALNNAVVFLLLYLGLV